MNDVVAATKADVQEVMTAFEQFKATNDAALLEIKTKGSADPLLVEKVDRLNAKLDDSEKWSQGALQAQKAAKDFDELKAQLDALVLKLGRPAAVTADERRAEGKAQFNTWMRGVMGAYAMGEVNLPEDQKKALAEATAEAKAMIVGDDTLGGYLAPVQFDTEIIKGITLLSPIRQVARVRTTAMKSMNMPIRTGQFAARRAGENDARTETTGLKYGMVEVNAPEAYAIVDISNANLEDSAFDLGAEVQSEAELQFALLEGLESVTGTGPNQMEGFLNNTSIGTTNSGAATTITADGLLTTKYAVKTGYARNATWLMNRTTLGSVRKLKDGEGDYLWQMGIANAAPNTIDGDPYVEFPDMPLEGAGLKPVAYGDWNRAYTVLDRIAMSVLRDPYSQADNGMVRFRFRKRVGGRVTLAEAVQILVCT